MKTLRKNKLLGLFLAAFMALAAFIGILVTIPRSASADTTETVDISALVEKEYDGTAVAGRYFKITPYDRTSNLSNNNLFLKNGVVVLIRLDDGSFGFRDCGADKMLSLEEVVGLEIVEATSKYYVLYFAEDFKFTSSTGDSSLYFDAAVDGIDMPIDSVMNCYTTELVKPITYDMNKIEYDGTVAAGRYFRVEGGSNNAFSLSFDKANVALYISTSGFQLLERENFTFHALQEEFAMPEMIRCYNDITPEGYSNYIFEFYIPEGVAKANNGAYSIDFNAEGFTVDSMVAEGFYELVNPNAETPKDEDDTWLDGIHDWGVQAGEDVSAWLKDNTGIAISGGGVIVLFVIGLLIFGIRGRRRRK